MLEGHVIEPMLNAAVTRHQLDSEVMMTLGDIVRVVSLKVRVCFPWTGPDYFNAARDG